jgi:hypothetical protein
MQADALLREVLFRQEHISEYHAPNWLAASEPPSESAFAIGAADGDADAASGSTPIAKKRRKSAVGAEPAGSNSVGVSKYQWALFSRLCAMAKSPSSRATHAALHALPFILDSFLAALSTCVRRLVAAASELKANFAA